MSLETWHEQHRPQCAALRNSSRRELDSLDLETYTNIVEKRMVATRFIQRWKVLKDCCHVVGGYLKIIMPLVQALSPPS